MGFTGMKNTEESKQMIGESLKGAPQSKEKREKLRIANTGKHLSIITKQKISKSLKGKHLSLATRKKMSESRMGEKHPFFGKTFSDDYRKKLSESHKGKIHTELQKEKIGAAQRGEKNTSWKGGISFYPYCSRFNNPFKERVRVFFGYKCMMPGCGHTWQPGEKKLAVHHVNYKKDSCCNQGVKPLFVPVCANGCHPKTNHNRGYWEQYFTNLIETVYGGKCYFTEDEMLNGGIALC